MKQRIGREPKKKTSEFRNADLLIDRVSQKQIGCVNDLNEKK